MQNSKSLCLKRLLAMLALGCMSCGTPKSAGDVCILLESSVLELPESGLNAHRWYGCKGSPAAIASLLQQSHSEPLEVHKFPQTSNANGSGTVLFIQTDTPREMLVLRPLGDASCTLELGAHASRIFESLIEGL